MACPWPGITIRYTRTADSSVAVITHMSGAILLIPWGGDVCVRSQVRAVM